MGYIKLYEAYSIEDYQKLLSDIKDMVSKGSKKDDILQKINKFSIDDASNLDKLRVILESIQREYILNYSHIIFIETDIKHVKKRKSGADWRGSWEAGDTVKKSRYDTTKHIIFEEKYLGNVVKYTNSQYVKYNDISSKISDKIDIRSLELMFEEIFDIMEWSNDVAVDKFNLKYNYDVNSYNSSDPDNKQKLREDINKLNAYVDDKNEVMELERYIKMAKGKIKELVSSL